MIQLSQNIVNIVYQQLTCNSDLFVFSGQQPTFLFSLTSETSNQVINFIAPNIAPISALTRYDKFLITVTGSSFTNLTGGCINLPQGNLWNYNIWEQISTSNLNPLLALDIVSSGQILYTPIYANGYIYYDGQANNTFFNTYNS